MAELVVENLRKMFGGVRAVDDVSFRVADGEFLTLLGPSGCGKSTTLAAIAGLDAPDSGLIRVGDHIFFDGNTQRNLPAEARNCGLVFQSYALWPHMTVRANVAFPLKIRRVKVDEQRRRIDKVLALVEMDAYADRYPHQLSGGQQQRVALARTLVYDPTVLLLDEPLSNLDAKLRERARTWLNDLQQTVRITTIYVTHDQTEALALSDRIAVMNKGKIVQIGTPWEIYERPVDPFVADFIGTSSFLHGRLKESRNGRNEALIAVGDGMDISSSLFRDIAAGSDVVVSVRPEKMQLLLAGEGAPQGSGSLVPASILSKSYLGSRWQYQLKVGRADLKIETAREFETANVIAWIPTEGCVVFEAAPGEHRM
jgi:iron(III) transport system ATP-binding protein